jgi:acyl-CoA synthetase (NDP forming)
MLEPFFNPHGVAVIGASRDPYKPGYGVVRNLAGIGYRGPVYPVNPAATHIMGYACYLSVVDVPDPVDLAVVIVPAPSVVSAIEQCAGRGIGHIIVVSGGFGETVPEGQGLEADLAGVARKCGVRVVGPNCNGIIDTYTPISTAFTVGTPRSGDIGFVSQSGALCVILMDIASHTGNGSFRLVSLGNQVDVSEAEILTALAGYTHTHVIAAYIEGVVDGRAFMRAAEEAARRKPIVAIKARRKQ